MMPKHDSVDFLADLREALLRAANTSTGRNPTERAEKALRWFRREAPGAEKHWGHRGWGGAKAHILKDWKLSPEMRSYIRRLAGRGMDVQAIAWTVGRTTTTVEDVLLQKD